MVDRVSKDAHFFIIAPRCQVTAFTICNWICATMQPSLQSERKFFFHFFLGSFWGTHINSNSCKTRCRYATATCFLIKVFLINFKFVLVNIQRMQYCTMRCHYATLQLYNYATMPLVHLALQSKCKLKDHNKWLHLRQGLATEPIVANHSESCDVRFGVETVCMEQY